MMIRDVVTKEYVGIRCDRCETLAPPAAELLKGHGLVNMGWHCTGGTHLCPDHAAEKHICKFCGAPTAVDPSDQTPPADYCDHS